MFHRCPVAGCSARCADEYVMCVKHWRLVNPDIRKRVWTAYRRAQARGVPPLEWSAWRDAAKLAIDYAAAKATPEKPGSLSGQLRLPGTE
jgi:hypothetical protein